MWKNTTQKKLQDYVYTLNKHQLTKDCLKRTNAHARLRVLCFVFVSKSCFIDTTCLSTCIDTLRYSSTSSLQLY